MKIVLKALVSYPGSIDEIVEKMGRINGKEITQAQAEEFLADGMRQVIEGEKDDEMRVESVTVSFQPDEEGGGDNVNNT